MSYELRIKGRNNTLVVSTENGKKLISSWENFKRSKIDSVIELNGWIGSLSDIRDFTFASDSPSATGSHSEKVQQEYMRDLLAKRKLTPEQRANATGFFSLFYFTYTGLKPSEEQKQKAIEIQKEFFTENPKRTICDPVRFRPMIENNRTGFEAKDGLRKLPMVTALIKMLRTIVSQDLFAERHL